MNPIPRCLPLLSLLLATTALAAPEPRVEFSTARDFGYTLGTVIEHRITVAVPEGYHLETQALPAPGALDDALDLRDIAWEADPTQGETRYRLRVVYQTFKGVRASEAAKVPALTLRFRGPDPMETQIPAWNFTVTPLIPPDLADDKVTIRPALPPEPMTHAPHRLIAALVGIAAVSALWAWWRYAPSRQNRPFARAYRELRRDLRGPVSLERFRTAAKRLHRALDDTAGGTLFADQLAGFCAERPAFAALGEDLAAFFVLSQQLFFTAPDAPPPEDFPAARLETLCRRCAAAERGR